MRIFKAIFATATLFVLASSATPAPAAAQLTDEGPMPDLSGATTWLNSKPLTAKALRGKVVLIDFWTYSCINCLRALPYIKAWDAKYRSQGLVVIGVHAPEFDFEKDSTNVRKSLVKLGITYPIAMDNDMNLWNAFHNEYWPAHYFIDANGRIRHHHFGEGGYDESEKVIRQLLMEAHKMSSMPGSDTSMKVAGTGEQAAPDFHDVKSPESYVGYARGERMAGNQTVAQDAVHVYTAPPVTVLNSWAFGGSWHVTREYGENTAGHATLTFRFHARDLNLVLGPATKGRRIKFHVTVDGQRPGADAGTDIDANGNGVVTEHRLYQLVRQHGAVRDRTFVITFDAPAVRAYAFTFG